MVCYSQLDYIYKNIKKNILNSYIYIISFCFRSFIFVSIIIHYHSYDLVHNAVVGVSIAATFMASAVNFCWIFSLLSRVAMPTEAIIWCWFEFELEFWKTGVCAATSIPSWFWEVGFCDSEVPALKCKKWNLKIKIGLTLIWINVICEVPI